jgi:hypothetical protein
MTTTAATTTSTTPTPTPKTTTTTTMTATTTTPTTTDAALMGEQRMPEGRLCAFQGTRETMTIDAGFEMLRSTGGPRGGEKERLLKTAG